MGFDLTVTFYNDNEELALTKEVVCEYIACNKIPCNITEEDWQSFVEENIIEYRGHELNLFPQMHIRFNGNKDELHNKFLKKAVDRDYDLCGYLKRGVAIMSMSI